ncbi:hypothetical protein ACFL6Z_09110 [Pseudomonadota bacterium]|uniref:hypothetical protein n=1 Tax=unclassified Shewanella TaxID=196818 RepID=UPI000C85A8B9|nr:MULTISPECIES: hypothetical protein [unclassified Shewanella]MDO6776909.1 hypothetical protein [Shewanella sp. 3_MG-2023]PMG29912.1 hypothetical protein BCU94_12300 [Shewanella sp. 10N.286.52.C2]PMH85629.1 hypothetical protein BCU57_13710 [Shewanella sp. 10N.286.48.B5]
MRWRVLLITLAYMLLGAHFLRYAQMPLAIICAVMPLLLAFKNNFLNRIIQIGLVLGTIGVWGVSTVQYIDLRIAMEQPWLRLAAIMTGVMLFSLFASYSVNGLVKQARSKQSLFR